MYIPVLINKKRAKDLLPKGALSHSLTLLSARGCSGCRGKVYRGRDNGHAREVVLTSSSGMLWLSRRGLPWARQWTCEGSGTHIKHGDALVVEVHQGRDGGHSSEVVGSGGHGGRCGDATDHGRVLLQQLCGRGRKL